MSKSKQKDNLKDKSKQLKKALTDNITDIQKNSKEIYTGALIGGGVLLAGYIIYRMLRGSDEEIINENTDKIVVVNSRPESSVSKMIKSSIATFLLAIAKQKILEYLDRNKEEVEQNG